MNKTELIKAVSKHSGENEDLVRNVINSFVEVIKDSLWYGMDVKIKDFLTFTLVKRDEAVKRHFKAGNEIIVPKHFYIRVVISKIWKNKMKTKKVH